MIKQNSKQFKWGKMSYWENYPKKAFKTVLLLSPGASGADFFNEFIPYFDNDYKFIAPDFPGRGESQNTEQGNSINLIADKIIELVDEIDLESFVIFSISFGTTIANEVAKKIPNKIEHIIFIGSGEFLPVYLKPFASLLILPLTAPKIVCVPVSKFLKLFISPIRTVPDYQLKCIAQQYLSALWYKLRFTEISSISATFINFEHDYLITSKSKKLLKRVYPKSKTYQLDIKHVIKEANTDFVMRNTLPSIIRDLKWKMPENLMNK